MILLNEIIEVFALPDSEGFFFGFIGVERSQCGGVRPTFIKGHDLRLSRVASPYERSATRQRCPVGRLRRRNALSRNGVNRITQ